MMLALVVALVAQAPPDVDAKLAELRALHDAAECERVITSAPSVEGDAAATRAQRHDAMFRRGDCLVAIGNIREASEVFQRIFADDVKAQVPFEIEPRVEVLVAAARAEIERRRAQEEAERRAKLVERIAVEVSPPRALKGGSRAIFEVTLHDPDGVVRSMRLDFKRRGDPEFYALPVVRRSDGTWRGEVPGTFTRTATGTVLHWYVTASDDKGERLKSFGSRAAPHELTIDAGSVVADDLRANERMGTGTRLAISAVAGPVVSGVVALAVASVGYVGALSTYEYVDRPAGELVIQATAGSTLWTLGAVLGSATGATASTVLMSGVVLDGTPFVWASAVPVALYAAGAALGLAGVLVPTDSGLAASLFTADIVVSGAGVVASAVVGTAFVLNDPPEE